MKIKFFTIKKKTILAVIFCGIFAFGIAAAFVTATTSSPLSIRSVVIDAGHGGIDGGCVGQSGVSESTLNLAYAKTLKRYFEDYGFRVVMTRENENGLYGAFAQNKKKDDMKKRKEIIERVSPDFVISIHMNSYPSQKSRGAQVFYNKDMESSKVLAENIQSEFQRSLIKPRQSALAGDYFMVSCTRFPAVIVECGFVSNIEEEKLLLSEDYRENLCYSILCGAFRYLQE